MSSRSFLGELQEFWGALYGFAEQGCKWFSCVGFKDKQLLSVDWDAKPVSKFASAKRKEKEMNKPTIHTSFSPTFYRISFLNSKCMKKWQQSTGYCPQCWHGSKALPIIVVSHPPPTLIWPQGFFSCGFSLRPKLSWKSSLSWSTNVTKHSQFLSNITRPDLLHKGGAG